MGNQGYSVPDEAPKVPRGGWTDHIFGPAIKQILCSYIEEPNPDTIEDILRDPNTQDYVFSCKGDFYFCNCLSDGTFLVLEPKGKAALWEQMDEDISKVRLRDLYPDV
ncbi:hypothetical protein BDR07DRAFT_598352 [Suillus spraguei]|nr:hypothetical protein BDR07DRAFT_598352 [Suillus spraguei]